MIFLVSLVLILGFSSLCFADSTETDFTFDQSIQEKLNFKAEADYQMDTISKLEYYNQKGYKDKNKDGQLTIAVVGTLDFSESSYLNKGLKIKTELPVVIKGKKDGEIINCKGNFILTVVQEETQSPLGIVDMTFKESKGLLNTGKKTYIKNCTVKQLEGEKLLVAEKDLILSAVDIIDCKIKNKNGGIQVNNNLGIYQSNITNYVCTGSFSKIEGNAVLKGVVFDKFNWHYYFTSVYYTEPDNGIYAKNIFVKDSEFKNFHLHLNKERSGYVKLLSGKDIYVENSACTKWNRESIGDIDLINGTTTIIKSFKLNNCDFCSISSKQLKIQDSGFNKFNRLKANELFMSNVIINDLRKISVSGSIDMEQIKINKMGSNISARTINIRNTFFMNTEKIEGDKVLLENLTIYAPESTNILSESFNYQNVDVLEAQEPIFYDELPDLETKIFVDTDEDQEEWGKWNSDKFWSKKHLLNDTCDYDSYKNIEEMISAKINKTDFLEPDKNNKQSDQSKSRENNTKADKKIVIKNVGEYEIKIYAGDNLVYDATGDDTIRINKDNVERINNYPQNGFTTLAFTEEPGLGQGMSPRAFQVFLVFNKEKKFKKFPFTTPVGSMEKLNINDETYFKFSDYGIWGDATYQKSIHDELYFWNGSYFNSVKPGKLPAYFQSRFQELKEKDKSDFDNWNTVKTISSMSYYLYMSGKDEEEITAVINNLIEKGNRKKLEYEEVLEIVKETMDIARDNFKEKDDWTTNQKWKLNVEDW